jgi:hypothetical protein
MTPSDPSVLRRKLVLIVENLKALEPIAAMPLQRYRDELFVRKGIDRGRDRSEHPYSGSRWIWRAPDDYYHGFLRLAEHGVLTRELAEALAPSAGLSNRLVHEYDAIVDAIVLDAVRKAQSLFPQYVAAVERYFSNRPTR